MVVWDFLHQQYHSKGANYNHFLLASFLPWNPPEKWKRNPYCSTNHVFFVKFIVRGAYMHVIHKYVYIYIYICKHECIPFVSTLTYISPSFHTFFPEKIVARRQFGIPLTEIPHFKEELRRNWPVLKARKVSYLLIIFSSPRVDERK